MKSLNLKLFTMALAAVVPAFTNTLTADSDSTGVHLNYTHQFVNFQHGVVQVTATPSSSMMTGDDSGIFQGRVSFGSNLASFSDASGEHVFYIGWDCNVYQVLYPPTPRAAFTITNLTNVSNCSAPGSFPALSNLADEDPTVTTGLTACSGAAGNFVFYVAAMGLVTGSDKAGHLIMLSSGVGGTPSNIEDLTATFGGPAVPLGSNLVSFCSVIGAGEQVFYVDTNYNVNEFYFVPFLCRLSVSRLPICGPGFQNSNLTAATGAPTTFVPPQSGPNVPLIGPSLPLTGFQDGFGTHIFYVASNQNINQLWLPPGGAWSNQDVMPSRPPVCIGGRCPPPPPLPVVTTALSSLADPQGNEHVFYIDANQGISELSHNPNSTVPTLGNGWFYGSPSVSAGITGSPNIFLFPADSGCTMMQLTSLVDNTGAVRVYYVDPSGDPIQLFLGSTGWSFIALDDVSIGTIPSASSCAPGNH
jgi:hypothetical protein